MMAPVTLPRLITIPLSHYCEKARWALERAGIAFTEERHAPLFHMLPSFRASGHRTTPVLVTNGGVHAQSADIVRWASDHAKKGGSFFPDDPSARAEVDTLCARFDDELGPHVRRYIYFEVLPDPRITIPLMTHQVPRHERLLMPVIYRAARVVMKKAMRIDAAGAERSRDKTLRVFDEVSKRLEDGRRFLAGDKFSAADLTFAALAAPAVSAPGYCVPLPDPSELPARAASLTHALRETPAGAFCLRMYRDERR